MRSSRETGRRRKCRPGPAHVVLALMSAFLFAAACGKVDCRKVDCYRPVACCAGSCSDGFDPDPPPAKRIEECCSCRGSVFADTCPRDSRCYKEWVEERSH